MGAPAAFELDGGPWTVRLLSVHEHWLVCPMHILWKLDREVCEAQQCIRCTLHGRRAPQLWRSTGLRDRAVGSLDAVLCPNQTVIENHRVRGLQARFRELPYFVPETWAQEAISTPRPRPYFLLAGRLIKAKGFQDVIPLMRELPEADLLVAGDGPYRDELRRLAAGLANVELLGQLDGRRIAGLMADARAVIVPSLCHEAFANVQLEAFTVGTPVVARRLGALVEVNAVSGAGLLFSTRDELLGALRAILGDPALRDRLGAAGLAATRTIWSEEAHLDRYLALVAELAAQRAETAARMPSRGSSTSPGRGTTR